MTIIDSNNGRCPICGYGAFVVVTWEDAIDATRDIELRVTFSCYNGDCKTSFSHPMQIAHSLAKEWMRDVNSDVLCETRDAVTDSDTIITEGK